VASQIRRTRSSKEAYLKVSQGWSIVVGAVPILGVAIGIFKLLRDRSSVKVNLCLEQRGPNDPVGPYLVTTAMNRGRRPVTIEEIGIEYANGTFHLATVFWPKDLRPPATLTESRELKGFVPADAPLVGGRVRGGFAKTSEGKIKRSPRWVRPRP
jgi:hypothetical protein